EQHDHAGSLPATESGRHSIRAHAREPTANIDRPAAGARVARQPSTVTTSDRRLDPLPDQRERALTVPSPVAFSNNARQPRSGRACFARSSFLRLTRARADIT